ncbi:MAG: hypothetical protein ACJ8C4_09295 [Gemmataceae bacterium]
MFGWFKRKATFDSNGEVVVAQPPDAVFPWPKGAVLTAVDEVTLALPTGLFDGNRPLSEFVFGPDDLEMNIPPGGDTFFIRLMPGMSVSLAKSVQSRVLAEDKRPKRIRVKRPPAEA